MKGKGIFCFLIGALIVVGYIFTVNLLWNWLMPSLFDVREITFVESIGLTALAKLLFGFGGKGCCGCKGEKKGYWKEKMKIKYANMTEEEKEKFNSKMSKWCGDKC